MTTTIDLHDTEFYGRTGRPPSSSAIPSNCTRCGSSLGGRRQKTTGTTIARTRFVVETWICGCGKRRVIRTPVVA